MGAGEVVIGAEGPAAVTVHQPIPQHVVYRLMIPSPHAPQVAKAARGAVRAAVAGLLRIVRQRNKGRFYRYGPAGHSEGVFAAALGRQLDLVPPAVGDGQSVQHIAAVRGDSQGDSAAIAGIGAVGGHFAMLRLLHSNICKTRSATNRPVKSCPSNRARVSSKGKSSTTMSALFFFVMMRHCSNISS